MAVTFAQKTILIQIYKSSFEVSNFFGLWNIHNNLFSYNFSFHYFPILPPPPPSIITHSFFLIPCLVCPEQFAGCMYIPYSNSLLLFHYISEWTWAQGWTLPAQTCGFASDVLPPESCSLSGLGGDRRRRGERALNDRFNLMPVWEA